MTHYPIFALLGLIILNKVFDWASLKQSVERTTDERKESPMKGALNMLLPTVMKGSRVNRCHHLTDEIDENVSTIVHVIVNNFDGDTLAFFDSIRPDDSKERQAAEQNEANVARRFAKSLT